jgi:hypothetical protein
MNSASLLTTQPVQAEVQELSPAPRMTLMWKLQALRWRMLLLVQGVVQELAQEQKTAQAA